MADKIDKLTPDLFLDGPGQFLVKTVASLIAAEPHFAQLFGSSVDCYDREDYSMRELPALRFYSLKYTKEHESHYITGSIEADVILPPSLRREQLETVQSQVSAALLQQFRRPSFFEAVQAAVPGLNELGKSFEVDKALGFQNEAMGDALAPLTHITLNFRLDLKQWDEYLEQQARTKDDPFDVTLGNLQMIAATIQAIRIDADLTTADVAISTSQT